MAEATDARAESTDTTSVAAAPARRDKMRLLRNVCGTGAVVIVASAFLSGLVGGPLRNFVEDRSEASSSEYADMAQVPKACPMLAERARHVLSDGRLTQLEVRGVASEMFQAEHDYDEALRKANAVAEAGGPHLDVPPPCSSTSDEIGFSPLLWRYRPKLL